MVKCAVVGGGYGGATLVGALAEYPGVRVDLYERFSDLGTQSARRSAGQHSPDDGGPFTEAAAAIYTYYEKKWNLAPILSPCPTLHIQQRGYPDTSYQHVWRNGEQPGLRDISPTEAADYLPLLRTDQIEKVAVDERDKRLNPAHRLAVTEGLAGLRRGSTVRGATVVAIDRTADGRWAVTTQPSLDEEGLNAVHTGNYSRLTSGWWWTQPPGQPGVAPSRTEVYDCVVNAAGASANEIAVLAGQPCPDVKPTMGTSFTAQLPSWLALPDDPVMAVWDTHRFAGGYISTGPDRIYGSPIYADYCFCVPQEPEPDIRAINEFHAAIDELTGIDSSDYRGVQTVGCMRTLGHGPNHIPIVGPSPHDNGFFYFCGLGHHGVQLAVPFAEYLASMITGKAPPGPIADALAPHADYLASCLPASMNLRSAAVAAPYGEMVYPRNELEQLGSAENYLTPAYYLPPLRVRPRLPTEMSFAPVNPGWVLPSTGYHGPKSGRR